MLFIFFRILEDYQHLCHLDQKRLVLEKLTTHNGGLFVQQTPDGGNVGIIDHLSIIARVTNNISETKSL